MKNIRQFFFVLIVTFFFTACMFEATMNNTPELTEDYSSVINHIKNETQSSEVEIWESITKNNDQKVERAELRVDLIKPNAFASLNADEKAKAKALIAWLKSKLKTPEMYDRFSLNEIREPEDSHPSEKVAASIHLSRDEMK